MRGKNSKGFLVLFVVSFLNLMLISDTCFAITTEWVYKLQDNSQHELELNLTMSETGGKVDIRTKLSGDHKKISRVPFMSRDIRNKKRITTMTKKTISGRRQMVLSTFSPGDRKKWKLEYGENKVDVRTGRVNFTVMESIPVLNTEGFIFSFSQGNFQKIGSKLYIADIRWANKIGLRSISTEGGETLYDFGVFEVTKDVNGLPVLIKSLNRSNEWNLRLTSLPAVNITPKIKTDQGEVTMKWQKPSDNEVEGYSIWKKTSDDGEYVNIKKNNHGKIFSEPLDTSGDGITTLSYQVGFKKRDGSVKYFSRPVSVTLLLNSPDAPRMTSYRGAPVVNWKRIPPGVDGINIYRREEGKKLKKLRSFKYETEYEDSSISSNCCKKYFSWLPSSTLSISTQVSGKKPFACNSVSLT